MRDQQPSAHEHDTTPGETSSSPGSSTDADSGSSLGSKTWSFVKEILSIAVIALVISFLIKTFVLQAFWIPSGSMENTLVFGDRVIVSKIQAGPLGIDRGDVVVFEDPDDWLPPEVRTDRGPVLNPVVRGLEFVGLAPTGQGNHLIKRVIGVGGDQVECCDEDGRMSVNGVPLDEDYLFPGDEPSEFPFDITVPDDSLWVMGDHRSISGDSRLHDDGTGAVGSVPTDRIVGQAMALVWPLGRADWFQNPQTFSTIGEPPTVQDP